MSDDADRAKRARQRAEEEQREVEARAAAVAASQTAEQRQQVELHRRSCHALGSFAAPQISIALVGITVIALAVLVPTISESSPWPSPKDPLHDVILWGIAAVIVIAVALFSLGVSLIVRGIVNRAYEAELAWMRALPFRVQALDRGILTTTSGRELTVKIPLSRSMPGATNVAAMLAHVDPGGKVDSDHDHQLRITARVAGEPEGDVTRVRARRLLFHDLVDGVLRPLHAQQPFDHVELSH